MSGKHLNDISKVYLDTIANVKKAETNADIKRWEDLGGPTPGNYRADDNSAKLKEGRRLRKSDWRQDLKEVIDKPETEEKAEKKVSEKKIKNKVVINPSFKEAIEEIGGELLEVNEVDSVQKTQDETQKKQEKHKKQLEQKQKKIAAMKKLVLRKKMQAVGAGGGEDITAGYEPEGEVIDERLGGKGYQPYTSLTGKKVSGDWEDSDRGAGNKAKKRAGGKVEKKSPTYLAHVHNKEGYEAKKTSEVLAAFKRDPKVRKRFEKAAKKEDGPGSVKNRAADSMLQTAKDTAKRKGDTSKSDDRYAYEEVVLEKDLSAAERRALPNKDFALPGKGEGPEGKQRGAYPINDKKHARAALAMAAAHASPEKEAKVKAAVKKKYPGIEVSEAAGKAVGTVVKQLARIGAKKLKSKKVQKAIYKKGKEIAKKVGQAGLEGATDAAVDRARETGGNIVRDAGKKKEQVNELAISGTALATAAVLGATGAGAEHVTKKALEKADKKKEKKKVDEGVLSSIGKKKKEKKATMDSITSKISDWRKKNSPKQKEHEKYVNFLPVGEAKESYEINPTAHKAAQKKTKMRNLAIGNENPNEKAAAEKKAGGPKLVGEADDKAYNYVVSQLKKKYGKDAVLTKGQKPKPPSAAQKKKNAEIMAKRAKEDHRDPTEKASDGRYSDRYSNRGSD